MRNWTKQRFANLKKPKKLSAKPQTVDGRYSTRQYFRVTLGYAKLTLVSFWRRNRLASRITALVLAAVILFGIFLQVYEPTVTSNDYALTGSIAKLIDKPLENYAEKLTVNPENGDLTFNQDFVASSAQSGDSINPKITATFDADNDKSVTITDPINQVSASFKPDFLTKKPLKNSSRVVYPIIGKDAVKVYSLKGSGIKEDIILRSYPNTDEVSFDYSVVLSEGLEMRLENDGSIGIYGVSSELLGNVSTTSESDAELLKKARENGKKTKFLFGIPAPVVVEFNNNSSDVKTWFTLEDNKLSLHAEGLSGANYPLSIDPTIYVETARKLMRGNNETNTDFDIDNELIQKSQTTGARIDEWNETMDLNEGRWNQATAVAGGFIYSVGGEKSATTVSTYTTPGADTFVVPAGVTEVTVKMWGAGGGGGGGSTNGDGGAGGGGGFSQATLSVTALESLNIVVGGGGTAGTFSTGGAGANSGDGGGGGGHSEVNRSGTPLIIAGGGAGGGGGDNSSSTQGGAGGAGGGTTGVNGGASSSAPGGNAGGASCAGSLCDGGNGSGQDGTTGASESGGDGGDGGASGTGTGSMNNGGTNGGGDGGMADVGGNGFGGGGGGGSGYFGGGGGSASISGNAGGGGGGGGSSYTTGTSTTNTAGSGTVPGNDGDAERGGYGDGGSGGSGTSPGTGVNGDGGKVIISYTTAGDSGPQSSVYWAEFSSVNQSVISSNPGAGACTDWCTNSVYDLPDERVGHSIYSYNGFLYVIGGEDDTGTRQSTVYIAKLGANGEPSLWHPTDNDPVNWDYWYVDTGLNGGTARSYLSIVAYNNRMYVLGGQTTASTGGVTTVEYADIKPNGTLSTWTAGTALPSVRHGHSVHAYNGSLYLIGGNSNGSLQNSVHYINLNDDGSMNTWQSTNSFTTARSSMGGSMSTIWGAYIYIGGGCSAVNGSGYCTTIASDMQLASINADGSINEWTSLGSLSNARIGYSLIAWQNGLYRLGGCSAQNASTGDCTTTLADVDYGVINPAGEVSTVNITVPSGTAPCSGGSPNSCDLPTVGDDAGEIGHMLSMSVILNGYLYVIGGCAEYNCNDGANSPSNDNISSNTAHVSIAPDGTMAAPSSCSGTSYGAWCVDSTNTINGADGVAAAGVTVFNNRIYIVGGIDSTGSTTGELYYNSVNSSTGALSGAWTTQTLSSVGISENIFYTYVNSRANPSQAGTYDGNLYVFGGCGTGGSGAGCASNDYETEVYKCWIEDTGEIENTAGSTAYDCTTSGQLQIDSTPGSGGTDGLGIHSGTVYANYIYLIGGFSQAESDKDDVIYARYDDSNNVVAVSGSDWIESPNKLSTGRRRGWAFGYNGHIYAVGGYDAGTGVIPFIEWSKMNVSDGSIDTFVTSSVTINQRWGLTMAVSNSYAYVIGGCDVGASPSGCSSFEPSIQTFQLYNNDSGSVNDFTALSDQTFSTATDRWGATSVVQNGYIYVAGGCTSATASCLATTNNVQYAPISSADGSIGTWSSTTGSLPDGRGWGQLEEAGGSLYYIGGEDVDAAAEIEHYSAKREAELTGTTTGWQSIAGTADSGTNSGNNGWIDSSNLTVGERYLILAWGAHGSDNTSGQTGLRVKHGSTAFTESQDIIEALSTGSNRKKNYFWFTVWTAVTGEDLEVELYNLNGSHTFLTEDITLIAINAEELITDGDLQYDINTSGGTLSTTPTAQASLSWTPSTNNDDWWIMSYSQTDTVDVNSDFVEGRLDVNGTVRSYFSVEGENSSDTPIFPLGWTEQLSNSSKTVDLELSESAANMEWDSAGVFALRIDRFETSASNSTSTATTLTQDVYSEAAAIDPDIVTSGDFLAVGGLTLNCAGTNSCRGRMLMQLGGSDVTEEVNLPDYDNNNDLSGSVAELRIGESTGVKDFDLDVVQNSPGPGDMDERWMVGFSMAQSPSTGDEKSDVYYATPNPTTGDIASWSTASNVLPADRTRFGSASWNDRLYVVGGLDDNANETNTVYVSPQLSSGGNITSAWTTTTSFDVARSGGAVTAYANNLYLFGGNDGSNYLSDSQFTQINSDGTVDAWTFSRNLQGPLSDGKAVAANGYMYIVSGRSSATVCNPKVVVAPISANTTIATGNNPTGVGEWYETNVRYTGDRYGAAVAYDDGKIYTMGGGCTSLLTSNRHYQSTLNSQPQVAIYSRMIDTDTDVFPNSWLLNGIDNSIGARWQTRYRSMNDTDGVATDCGTADMTTWGQETVFGDTTLGDVSVYTPKDGSGNNINCARYYYFFISIDASNTFGYPEDVNRGPTITDLSLFFSSDPNKRLRHGKTFTGGEQQPLDTPCRQSEDADCPLP